MTRHLIAMWLLFGANCAQAQTIEYFANFINDPTAKSMLQAGLDDIHLQQCGSSNCDLVSEDEKKNPPISVVDTKAAMAHAMMGAWAEFCGLDHRRAFMPMMAFGKYKMKFNERQLALMGVIYTNWRGRQLASYRQQGKGKGGCPPEVKEKFDKAMPRLTK